MIRIACATDDDVHFYHGHFGDAPYFLICEMEEDGRYSAAKRIQCQREECTGTLRRQRG